MSSIYDDVDLYSLVHELLLVRDADDQQDERRGGVRHPYECRQLISPYRIDGELPDQTTFRPVKCCDISPGGMSFHSDQLPDCERLVIALGTLPFIYIEARIMHVTECDDDRPGKYLVGCQFGGRIIT